MPLNGQLTKREISALENSYLSYEGAIGLNNLLWDADELLQTRGNGKGLRLYTELLNDPQIACDFESLAGAITSRELEVIPASDKRLEKKAADIVREQLLNLNTKPLSLTEENHSSINGFDALSHAFTIGGVLHGRHFAEVMWATEGNETIAREVRSRDPRQFAFAKGQYGYVLRHLTKEQPWLGVEVDRNKILVFSYGSLDGNPNGNGLGKVLFWPNFFKRNGIRFWLKFVERFASPKPTGKYPRGATRDQVSELRAALEAISSDSEVAIPEGMLIEYLEAAQSGTIDTYESLCKFMDAQISKAIRGETGTADQTDGGGSRARDEVANGVRLEKAKGISDRLSATWNRLAAWITEFNTPGAIPPKVWRNFDIQEDLNSRVNRDKTLFDLGYRLNADKLSEVYGDGYEEAGGDTEKPPLIATLGIGGVQALTGVLNGQLPRENTIAVLMTVFGISKEDAGAMVPEVEEKPEGGGLEGLFGAQGGRAEYLPGTLAGEEEAPPQEQTEFSETLDFALFGKGSKAKGKKPNCTAGKSHFCQTPNGRGSCVPLSKKCKYKPTGQIKQAADWTAEKAQTAPLPKSKDPEFISALKSENILLPEIKGSDKQIIWAKQIRSRLLTEFDDLIADFTDKVQNNKAKNKGIDNIINSVGQPSIDFIRATSTITNASTYINHAKNLVLHKKGNSISFNNASTLFYKLISAGTTPDDLENSYDFAESTATPPYPDTPDQITTIARPLIGDAIAPWLDTVRDFVQNSDSLEEIRDGLIDLYPELDGAAFAEAMGQAMLLAELVGREEVSGADDETEFAEAIEAAINGTIDFANPSEFAGGSFPQQHRAPLFGKGSKAKGKKPNCTAGKSHFCQTPNGRGSCVPLSKKCKYKPDGVVKEVADWGGARVQGSPTLPSNHALGTDKRVTTAKLDKVLRELEDEDNQDNFAMLREFIANGGKRAVFHKEGSEPGQDALGKIATELGTDAKNVRKIEGSVGYTHASFDHVVIANGGSKAFSPNATEIKEGVKKAIAGGDDWGFAATAETYSNKTLLVYLHEIGHQADYVSNKSLFAGYRPKGTKALTEYSGVSSREWAAEHFVAWLVAPKQYKAADPVGYDYIDGLMQEASGRISFDF